MAHLSSLFEDFANWRLRRGVSRITTSHLPTAPDPAPPRGHKPLPTSMQTLRQAFTGKQCTVDYSSKLEHGLEVHGHKLTDLDLIRLGFACSGSRVYIDRGSIEITGRTFQTIRIQTDNLNVLEHTTVRHLVTTKSGIVVVNQAVYLRKTFQRQGYSRLALALQLRTAALLGIRKIWGMVGGGETVGGIGHVVWPALGYDGLIPRKSWAKLPETERAACTKVLDEPVYLQRFLAASPNGSSVWQKHGEGFLMSLSTDTRSSCAVEMLNLLRRASL